MDEYLTAARPQRPDLSDSDESDLDDDDGDDDDRFSVGMSCSGRGNGGGYGGAFGAVASAPQLMGAVGPATMTANGGWRGAGSGGAYDVGGLRNALAAHRKGRSAGGSSIESRPSSSESQKFSSFRGGGLDPWDDGDVGLLSSSSLFAAMDDTVAVIRGAGSNRDLHGGGGGRVGGKVRPQSARPASRGGQLTASRLGANRLALGSIGAKRAGNPAQKAPSGCEDASMGAGVQNASPRPPLAPPSHSFAGASAASPGRTDWLHNPVPPQGPSPRQALSHRFLQDNAPINTRFRRFESGFDKTDGGGGDGDFGSREWAPTHVHAAQNFFGGGNLERGTGVQAREGGSRSGELTSSGEMLPVRVRAGRRAGTVVHRRSAFDAPEGHDE